MFAAVSVCSRKIEKGISGWAARDSQAMNPNRSSAESAKTPIVCPDAQPQSWPLVMPSTRMLSPEVTSSAPRMSKLDSRSSRLSERSIGAAISEMIPTGTLT